LKVKLLVIEDGRRTVDFELDQVRLLPASDQSEHVELARAEAQWDTGPLMTSAQCTGTVTAFPGGLETRTEQDGNATIDWKDFDHFAFAEEDYKIILNAGVPWSWFFVIDCKNAEGRADWRQLLCDHGVAERQDYAASSELATSDLKLIAGGNDPIRTGPVVYLGDTVFRGVVVLTETTCSFGFVREDGEVVRWDYFDFADVFVMGWRREADAVVAEIGSRKEPPMSKQKLSPREQERVRAITGDLSETRRLVRFLDGREGTVKAILEKVWTGSRFPIKGNAGLERDITGLTMLPHFSD
jgi:hypothetical protein